MSSDISRESFDARKRYSSVRLQQGRLLTDADWNEQARIFQQALETLTRSLLGSHALAPHDPEASFAISDIDWTDRRLGCRLQPGRYYVDGVAMESPCAKDFVFPVSTDTASVLLYLDAWEEEIGALLDPTLRDPALSGADTSQRTRLAWRLCCMPLEPGLRVTDGMPGSWQQSPAAGLRVRSTGYQGLENQLYRVQIHRAGRIGGTPPPTYKWARRNGSGLAAVMAVETMGQSLRIRVQHGAGPSGWQDAKAGDWIECLSGDACALDGDLPLSRLLEVDGDLLTLAADASLQAHLDAWEGEQRHVRLWNHPGDGEMGGAIPIDGGVQGNGWQLLENAIEITFGSGEVRAGDAWMIPARSTDGSVLWPAGEARPPDEPRRFTAPLAQVTRIGPDAAVHLFDCRHRVTLQRQPIRE